MLDYSGIVYSHRRVFFDGIPISELAEKLANLHEKEFGGKARGRYRISQKFMRHLAECRRIYPEVIIELQRALFQKGFVLIDMESYFVVMSGRTFSGYRRVGPAIVGWQPEMHGPVEDDQSDE